MPLRKKNNFFLPEGGGGVTTLIALPLRKEHFCGFPYIGKIQSKVCRNMKFLPLFVAIYNYIHSDVLTALTRNERKTILKSNQIDFKSI